MKRFRFSILGVMGIILVAALVLALVRVESGWVRSVPEGWAELARYLSVTILVIATYRARYRKGKEGDWWFGFALGGWSYYLFSGDMIWQWTHPTHMPDALSASLYYWVVGPFPETIGLFHDPSELRFHLARIVQALLVLFAAFVGGLICMVLSSRRTTLKGNDHAP
jgi:hypothetical protein